MADENILQTLKICRGYLLQTIKDVSDEQMLIVPDGANNNILWNLGHLAHGHAGLIYGPCGLTPPVPDNYGGLFTSGTSPSTWAEAPPVADVKRVFRESFKQSIEDYSSGAFDDFTPRDLVPGIAVQNVEQAFGFVCIHEGVHIGSIISILNLMGVSK